MSEGRLGGRAQSGDLLGDPHGGREDRKGARIGSACEERKSLAWEEGRIRPAEWCRVSRDIGSMIIETESWSGCANW